MPLFTLARKPGGKQFNKLNRCARSKSGALAALREEHGPIVGTRKVSRKGQTVSGEPPAPLTVYQFEDGTEAVLSAYVGMC
jgi:hypothetical protein